MVAPLGKGFHGMNQGLNRKFKFRVALFLFVGLSLIASSATARIVTTFGARTCAKWLKEKNDGASNESAARITMLSKQSWIAGYVTGVNRTSTNGNDLLTGLDLDTVTDWTDSYCQKNPKSDIINAIDALFEKLNRKQ